jgi:FkbM family methyltransferase
MASGLAERLKALGVYAGRLANRPYGQDMLLDIERLSAAWGRRIGTIFDVGANVGQSALHFAQVFPGATIYSFEPHPGTFKTLCAATEGRTGIHAFNLALGDADGEVDFFEYDNPLINSRIPDAAYPQRKGLTPRQLKVNQETLSRFCRARNIATIDFLKIDTEGFDVSVVAGAKHMLAAGAISFVSCEFAVSSEGKTTKVIELAGLFEQFGYSLLSTYLDYVVTQGKLFANGNVLFVRPPN